MRVRPSAGRRLTFVLPAAAAAALLALPAAAHADTDMTLVVDSVAEAGYYVDSGSKYFQSDGALDLLRDNKAQHAPLFVAVLPAGESPDKVLNGLLQGVKRKGTYAVISGEKLRIKSNALPQSQVKAAYDKAVSANASRPDKALISFVKLLPAAADLPTKRPKTQKSPAQPPLAETQVGADKQRASQRAEAVKRQAAQEALDDGGFPVLPVAGGGVVLALLAGGGFLLWRRRNAAPARAAAGGQGASAGGRPGGSAAPGPGPETFGASGPAAGEPQQQPSGGTEGGQGPRTPGGQHRS